MQFILPMYLILMSLMNFILTMIFLFNKYTMLIKFNLLNMLNMNLEFIMFIDWMSLMFSSVVMLISSMVLIYSLEYMNNDINKNRFMILVSMFLLSMILMIFSPNMLSILLGWDGLGLSSFCLIIFYQNKKSMNSGIITMLMNRIGDINIILMISLLINNYSLNFLLTKNVSLMIMILIIFASITKSAQIPFSTWLPMAMAAPTPVSALVHSSTLVTAGVYLLIRMNYLFSSNMMLLMMIISSFTMILASSSAMIEYDLKKIIALSTLSQLSLMILTMSMNLNMLSFFHLITHAMFKSLIFLCSGIMIHNYFNSQDIRYMNFMNKNIPLTMMIFNCASITLCGMPFLSGFYSKDLIIDFFNMYNMNFFIFNIMLICMMLTATYSLRLMYYLSTKNPLCINFSTSNMNNKMNYSIYILFIMSVIYGSMLNWMMFNSINMIIMPKNLKIYIYKLIMISLLIYYIFNIKILLKSKIMKMMIFFNYMWFMPLTYQNYTNLLMTYNNKIYLLKNNGWLELLTYKKLKFFFTKINLLMNLNKLNFLIIMILSSYLILLILIF